MPGVARSKTSLNNKRKLLTTATTTTTNGNGNLKKTATKYFSHQFLIEPVIVKNCYEQAAHYTLKKCYTVFYSTEII